MKKVGILFDNVSGNTGDIAIGLSVVKVLAGLGVEPDLLYPGCFNPADYEPIIIGGGHILREGSDFFYDKFKVLSRHILNAAGILGSPRDLGYLDDYKYVTVRSSGDKARLSYLKKKAKVVPCTTMLLDDIEGFKLMPKKPCIGVNLCPGSIKKEEERALIRWASSLPYTVYFIPITHYNHDDAYMRPFSVGAKGSVLLPRLNPMEIFTLMGRMDYTISCSLHGAIFSYVHNTPFILFDGDAKMRYFMEDRGLQEYMFKDFSGLSAAFDRLREDGTDYGTRLAADLKTLEGHVGRLKEFLPRSKAGRGSGSAMSADNPHYPGKLRLLALRLKLQASTLKSRLYG